MFGGAGVSLSVNSTEEADMRNPVLELALIAAAATLAPAAALAHEPGPRPSIHAGVHVQLPAVAVVPPARAVPPPTVIRVDDDDWRDGPGQERWRRGDAWRDGPAYGGWRHQHGWYSWRARERMELRSEYARLDEARARFYAFPRSRWSVRRFEAWYAREHAELDARWARVS